jgi:hypothetical protein
MGYQPKSLLRMHLTNMHKGYLRQNPKMGPNWVKQYQQSAQKIMHKMSREPRGVQDVMHNHILDQTIGPSRQNLHLSNDATVNKFTNNLHKVHNRLAAHYGIQHKLPKPPTDPKLMQTGTAGASTQGLPSSETHPAERQSLGMNPNPGFMRHPTPLQYAPGKSDMPGSKELGTGTLA